MGIHKVAKLWSCDGRKHRGTGQTKVLTLWRTFLSLEGSFTTKQLKFRTFALVSSLAPISFSAHQFFQQSKQIFSMISVRLTAIRNERDFSTKAPCSWAAIEVASSSRCFLWHRDVQGFVHLHSFSGKNIIPPRTWMSTQACSLSWVQYISKEWKVLSAKEQNSSLQISFFQPRSETGSKITWHAVCIMRHPVTAVLSGRVRTLLQWQTKGCWKQTGTILHLWQSGLLFFCSFFVLWVCSCSYNWTVPKGKHHAGRKMSARCKMKPIELPQYMYAQTCCLFFTIVGCQMKRAWVLRPARGSFALIFNVQCPGKSPLFLTDSPTPPVHAGTATPWAHSPPSGFLTGSKRPLRPTSVQ